MDFLSDNIRARRQNFFHAYKLISVLLILLVFVLFPFHSRASQSASPPALPQFKASEELQNFALRYPLLLSPLGSLNPPINNPGQPGELWGQWLVVPMINHHDDTVQTPSPSKVKRSQ